ncbi:EamA family transporter [Acidovorax sp. FHTAMBA]|jgi:drug/metabolite transporter (DMT)-like permease|uniref:EamA family transporter n=1 Tax=Acidovorax sp. FHTAMBA TaxID=3140252 RepID=UPI0015F47B05
MSPTTFAATIACVFGISLGQVLFRKAALSLSVTPSASEWLFNTWLIAALVLYAITTVGWVWVLRHAPLSMAYPVMGLAFLIVPCLSWLFLGEPIRVPTLIGGALILAGIALTAQGQ